MSELTSADFARSIDELPDAEIEALLDAIDIEDALERTRRIQAILDRHPEHRATLQQFVHGLDAVATQDPGELRRIRELGRGAMGFVHLAEDAKLQRLVAVKQLPMAWTADSRAAARFRQEALAVARLSHPGIVAVHGLTRIDGCPAYTMEYVPGASFDAVLDELKATGVAAADLQVEHLRAALHRASNRGDAADETEEEPCADLEDGPLSGSGYVDAVCRLVAAVADALEHAHRRGVLHRDIKPSNLMLRENGRPQVSDFGLARVEGEGRMTVDGERLFTLFYAAPEQIRGEHDLVDARSDVYSLGVTLYELLCLRVPFGGSAEHVLAGIESGEHPSLRSVHPGLSKDLATVCASAMSSDRERRYATMREFAEDLRRVLAREPVVARPLGAGTRVGRWVLRHKLASAVVGLSALVVVGGPVGFALLKARETARVRTERSSAERAAASEAMGRTRFAMRRGDWQSAMQALSTAEQYPDPDRVEIELRRIECLEGQLEQRQASARLELLLAGSLTPAQRARALLLRTGMTEVREMDRIEADARAVLALGADPGNAVRVADLEVSRSLLVDTAAQAIEHLDAALEHDPDHRRARLLLPALLLTANRLDECEQILAESLGQFPDDPQFHLGRAVLETVRGQSAEASLRRVMELIGEEEGAHYRRILGAIDAVRSLVKAAVGGDRRAVVVGWARFMPTLNMLVRGRASNSSAVELSVHPVLWKAWRPLLQALLAGWLVVPKIGVNQDLSNSWRQVLAAAQIAPDGLHYTLVAMECTRVGDDERAADLHYRAMVTPSWVLPPANRAFAFLGIGSDLVLRSKVSGKELEETKRRLFQSLDVLLAEPPNLPEFWYYSLCSVSLLLHDTRRFGRALDRWRRAHPDSKGPRSVSSRWLFEIGAWEQSMALAARMPSDDVWANGARERSLKALTEVWRKDERLTFEEFLERRPVAGSFAKD